MQPLLFLDIDGVIAVYGAAEDKIEPHMIGEIPVHLPQGIVDRVHLLLEFFDPVWCTGWRGSAHRSFRNLLQLGDELPWPYLDYKDHKLVDIVRYAKHRPWAWVDDDANWELAMKGWTDRHLGENLVINPKEDEGLTDEHTDILVEWALDHTS